MAAHLARPPGCPSAHESLRSWFADRIAVDVTVRVLPADQQAVSA
jgi:hypothetical protein